MSTEGYGRLADRISKASMAMPSLKKGDRNKHGDYSYVSVDDFFEKISSVAHQHGLSWGVRETASDIVEVGEKVDRNTGATIPQRALKTTYAFDMTSVDGDHAPEFFSVSILHPLQGAQTAGSSLSYAAKLFLRATFSVVTGEGDADVTDNKAFEPALDDFMGGAPAPEPVRKPATKPVDPAPTPPAEPEPGKPTPEAIATAVFMADTAIAMLKGDEAPKTLAELTDYWVKNDVASGFKAIKRLAPDAHAKLIEAFKARKQYLEDLEKHG